MPDAPFSLGAWLRRGWDAELLANAPATDEHGVPLDWSFPHHRNRSPLWRLRRPWVLIPTTMLVMPLVVSVLVRGSLPDARYLATRTAVAALWGTLLGALAWRHRRPKIQRMALEHYRRERWRSTREAR